ncbi:hypothetical protein B0H13DRAFT_1098423 [Mycena leptocephala]|nr:hypothetical protein B0H13DRAFT_1098423 [Mycena leptocephala]
MRYAQGQADECICTTQRCRRPRWVSVSGRGRGDRLCTNPPLQSRRGVEVSGGGRRGNALWRRGPSSWRRGVVASRSAGQACWGRRGRGRVRRQQRVSPNLGAGTGAYEHAVRSVGCDDVSMSLISIGMTVCSWALDSYGAVRVGRTGGWRKLIMCTLGGYGTRQRLRFRAPPPHLHARHWPHAQTQTHSVSHFPPSPACAPQGDTGSTSIPPTLSGFTFFGGRLAGTARPPFTPVSPIHPCRAPLAFCPRPFPRPPVSARPHPPRL